MNDGNAIRVTKDFFRNVIDNFGEIERLLYQARTTGCADCKERLIEDAEKLAHKTWKGLTEQFEKELR